MAARQTFWKWHGWKSGGFPPYTQVICYRRLDLTLKAKMKLESGNWKIQFGRPAVILGVTYLKMNRRWPMAPNNMHMKFEIEISKQTWVTETMSSTDGRTDRPTDNVNQVYPPPPPPPPPHGSIDMCFKLFQYLIHVWYIAIHDICRITYTVFILWVFLGACQWPIISISFMIISLSF